MTVTYQKIKILPVPCLLKRYLDHSPQFNTQLHTLFTKTDVTNITLTGSAMIKRSRGLLMGGGVTTVIHGIYLCTWPC